MIVYLGGWISEKYEYANLKEWFEDPCNPTQEEISCMEITIGIQYVEIEFDSDRKHEWIDALGIMRFHYLDSEAPTERAIRSPEGATWYKMWAEG